MCPFGGAQCYTYIQVGSSDARYGVHQWLNILREELLTQYFPSALDVQLKSSIIQYSHLSISSSPSARAGRRNASHSGGTRQVSGAPGAEGG